jgi:hypothetical protein
MDRRQVEDRRDLPRESDGRRAVDRARERQRKVDCPKCWHWDTLIIDNLGQEKDVPEFRKHLPPAYVRRRECQNPHCRAIFPSYEIHGEENLPLAISSRSLL